LAKKQGRKPAKKTKGARAARPKAAAAKTARAAARPVPPPAEDVSLSPVAQALARRRKALAARLAG
jgi:hypothetical protein